MLLSETQGTEPSKYLKEKKSTRNFACIIPRDSLSSGERTGNSLNLYCVISARSCNKGVVGCTVLSCVRQTTVKNCFSSRS